MSINYTHVLKVVGILLLGAAGALVFNVFLSPYFLASTYFENFQFVKDFKEGKIMVTKTDQVYIQENTALQNAIAKVKNSIVTVQGNYVASGLVVTSDGNIITLASAVSPNARVTIFLQREQQTAKVTKIDYKNNLALLKIDKNNLQTVAFADAVNLQLGQRVFLAAPTSITQDNWLANEGIVREIDAGAIKTSMTEKPIVAGGPLFDVTGELVGLNFFDADGRISAIPVSNIQNLLGL